jgi:hypothetical protein
VPVTSWSALHASSRAGLHLQHEHVHITNILPLVARPCTMEVLGLMQWRAAASQPQGGCKAELENVSFVGQNKVGGGRSAPSIRRYLTHVGACVSGGAHVNMRGVYIAMHMLFSGCCAVRFC